MPQVREAQGPGGHLLFHLLEAAGGQVSAVLAWFLAFAQGWQITEATWYAGGLRHPDALTCASRDFPRGSRLLVIHGGRWVVVKVNDFGPHPEDPLVIERERGLDLSRGAARRLGLLRKGHGPVLVIKVTP